MNKPMELIELYKNIVGCCGMVSDADGFLSFKLENNSTPAMVNGKRLVLPTQAQLMNSDQTNRIVFHPLSENIVRGESDVVSKLRSAFNIRLNVTFAAIAQNLLRLIASAAEHHKLTPDQSELLSLVKDVDDKTLTAFTKMMLNSIGDSPEKSFINIYLKRRCIIDGKIWGRGGVVSFPLMDELQKEQEQYYGVKLRAKDRSALIQLHEYIFPGLTKPEQYNRGSDSAVAPFLDALMKTVMSVVSKFNDVLELYGSLIDEHDELVFNSDWVESFENLETLLPQIRQIPMQAGNEGRARVGETPISPVQSVATPAPPPLNYHTPQPPPQSVAPVYGHQPQQYHQPQQPQPPQLVETDRGVTFDSLMRTNPAFAANATMAPRPMMAMQQPVQQAPRWAGAPQQFGMMSQQPMNMGYPQQMGYQQPMQQPMYGNTNLV